MTESDILEILKRDYPVAKIEPVPGNPNILGEYLFLVDGQECRINPEAEPINFHLLL